MSTKFYRKWKILCWNVRGLNSDDRQREVRAKIEESVNILIIVLLENSAQKDLIILHIVLLWVPRVELLFFGILLFSLALSPKSRAMELLFL
jgi:hypothetical protein